MRRNLVPFAALLMQPKPPAFALLKVVFHVHAEYREKYRPRMPPSHLAAMADIEQCRTETLGGQVYQCPECGELRYSYRSCQNRPCPKCQQAAGQEWLAEQQALLLPVPYFLLTFTLPDELREVARHHQKLIYGLLFRASAAATQQPAWYPRFVGGMLGMVGVLHTWTRALIYYPQIHYVVPGGVAADGGDWRPARGISCCPCGRCRCSFAPSFGMPCGRPSSSLRSRLRFGRRTG